MIWFHGKDTVGIEWYINLDRVQNVHFGPNSQGKTTATVVADRNTFYFRDQEALDRLKAYLEPSLPLDYALHSAYKSRNDYLMTPQEVKDAFQGG